LPELRAEAKKRGLTQIGTKQSLLARLSVRVRDEVATALGAPEDDAFEGNMIHDSDDDEGSSEEELVIIGNDDVSKHSDDDSFTSDPKAKNVNRDLENDEIPVDQINVPGCESSLQESLKRIFGYDNFREGQEWAIRRCLQHKKSLLVAPTGQGKSLCYALPATIMEGICIVVSPLVSLMEVRGNHCYALILE
jgi:superfamily II DNA helicase RecQ